MWSGAGTLAAALACAGPPPPQLQPLPELPPEAIATTLYLIGDAGKPDSTGEPVLEALQRDLAARNSDRVVVFLGDNVYPRGLPPPGQPGRHDAERSLRTQIGAITAHAARGYFVPGNHDWAKDGADGWEAIRRQERFIDSLGGGAVSLQPGGGCPGPKTVDIGRRLRLVLLDSQWWLHPGPKPKGPASGCVPNTEADIVDSLRSVVRGAAGRMVVVAQHHPMMSGGEHGGYFGFTDHLFPLRAAKASLWIPIPLLGSLYPTARLEGISRQDIGSRPYQQMILALRRAFHAAPPTLIAAGHEHNLQVIEGGGAKLQLVSGAGIYGHTGAAFGVPGSLFARNASGFARVDIPRTGRARLAILAVDRAGEAQEVFSTWVE
jgi:hypothetical protein